MTDVEIKELEKRIGDTAQDVANLIKDLSTEFGLNANTLAKQFDQKQFRS